MNGIQTIMSEPWVARLGWTLLHFLWQGTAIAVVYAAARFVFGRSLSANSRYGLACAALMAMAVSPLLTFRIISSPVQAAALVASWSLALTEWKWLPPVAVGLWATGVFWFSLRLFGAVQFTRRLRATAHPASDMWQKTLIEIGASMAVSRKQVRLMGSSMVNSPAVIGFLRPVVLVPVAFLTGLPAEHIIALLTHELAHVRRNDYLAGILQSVAEVVLFYHPAVWWISGQIRLERELCCDDLVIAAGTDRLTYARALTELESVRPGRLTPQLAANGGSLMDRIRRLIEPSYLGNHYLPGTGSALAMVVLLLAGFGVLPVHGAQTTPASRPAQSLSVPATTPVQQGSTIDSLVGKAQETLLYDPVFPPELATGTHTAEKPAATPAEVLVTEAVTVRNGSDAVIDALRKEDFAVTEDGKSQQITFFEFENVQKLADPAGASFEKSYVPTTVARQSTAGQINGKARYRDHRLLVFYFDMPPTPTLEYLRALHAAQNFVQAEMSQADVVCLIRNSGAEAEVLQDFTGNRDRLLSVIGTMAAGAASAPAGLDSGSAAFNADQKPTALQSVLKELGSLNEKKSLVYFSDGLNLSGMANQALMRVTINDAVRAGVSIWPVGNDSLAALGTDTGGKAMANSGEPGAVIRAAEQSISSYYIVGYSPTNPAQDGKFRRITVALNNTPNARLDYRQGYFTQKQAGDAGTDKERQLQDTLRAGDPVTDLPLAVEVNYFRQNNAEYFTPVTVKIPGNELVAAKNNGLERTLFDLIGEIKDDMGTTVSNIREHTEIRLADLSAAVLAARPFSYTVGFKLLPGNYSMKILVRNAESGKMGTFETKFNIPNLNKDPQLPISSVVLSSQFVEDNPSTGQPGGAGVDPMVINGRRIVPSVTRVFSSGSDMVIYLQAFEKGAKTAAPLTTRVVFYKGSEKVLEAPPLTVSDGLDPKSGMLPIRMNVGLGSLTPGVYDCQVTVLDPATQKSAVWQKPVKIVQ